MFLLNCFHKLQPFIQLPLWREMLNELAFAFRCRDSSSTSRPRDQINFKSLPCPAGSEGYPGVGEQQLPRLINTNYLYSPAPDQATLPPGGGHAYSRMNNNPMGPPLDQVDYYSTATPTASFRPQGGYHNHNHAQPHLKFVETPSILKNSNSNSNAYLRVDTKV